MPEACAICLQSNNEEDDYVTPCEHRFHRSCVSMWSNLSQTCPMCRADIGHISHSGITITEEQRERVQVAYKLFNMTEDNPELSGLQVAMREHRYTDTVMYVGWPTYDDMKVYLLIKGFEFYFQQSRHGNAIICKVNTEETEQQYRVMKSIMSGYNVPQLRTNVPEALVLKTNACTCYFVDDVPKDRPPKTGILNAIVRPKCVQHQGRNILQFWAVQVACTAPTNTQPQFELDAPTRPSPNLAAMGIHRNEIPQPQAFLALGLFTVYPSDTSVS